MLPATRHRAPGAIRFRTGDACRFLVQLRDPSLRLVQLQPVSRAAKTVGQDDVRSGFHEGALQLRDALGMLGIP